jgi:phosphatidylserine/phosphatidylglycerophosphate/cardiolipin synthase-like enzyme
MAIYHLFDDRIVAALKRRHAAGVPVRLVVDRHAYVSNNGQKAEVDSLYAAGIRMRINRHRGVMHAKLTILHGQRLVATGSMNYATMANYRTVNGQRVMYRWKEELVLFTSNAATYARYLERFDRLWRNTGTGEQTLMQFTPGMPLQSHEESNQNPPIVQYENPDPDPRPRANDPQLEVCFAPDEDCNDVMIAPVVRTEAHRLDIFLFRIGEQSVIDAVTSRIRTGMPVRVIVDSEEYHDPLNDSTRRAVAVWKSASLGNVQFKIRNHEGDMHMKSIIGTNFAHIGSGNYTWPSSNPVRGRQSLYYQEDDFIIMRDPVLVAKMRARFDTLWASGWFDVLNP